MAKNCCKRTQTVRKRRGPWKRERKGLTISEKEKHPSKNGENGLNTQMWLEEK